MIQKGDFVAIQYTGKLHDTGEVFDTTYEKIAREAGISKEQMQFGPVIICVGENQILGALDHALIGRKPGEYFKLHLSPEESFGKKNPKLIQLIAISKFTKHQIKPYPGLRVNVDGMHGTVKSASGGRVIVDFNHPLAGKAVDYEVTVEKIIEDDEQKLKGFFSLLFGRNLAFTLEGTTVTFKQPMPKELLELAQKEFSRMAGKAFTFQNPERKTNENIGKQDDEQKTNLEKQQDMQQQAEGMQKKAERKENTNAVQDQLQENSQQPSEKKPQQKKPLKK
ncbi:MAG: peptidylprolyl isomerase [Candidatus Woesearchaeota archaeon]